MNATLAPTAVFPGIPVAPLLVRERAVRAPLPLWAERLRGDLLEARCNQRRVSEWANSINIVANGAALIAVHEGDAARAAEISAGQLRWLHRVCRRSGDPDVAANAVSSWTNLARLEAIRGDWEAALDRLGALNEYREEGRLRLGAIAAEDAARRKDAESGGAYSEYLDDLYVTESLKGLLMNRRFDDALSFAGRLGGDHPPATARSIDEAVVVAACRLGDHDRARTAAVAAIEKAGGWDGVALRLRLVEVMATAGADGAAVRVLAPLAGRLAAPRGDTVWGLQALYVLLRASALCGGFAMDAESAAVAARAFELAGELGDEAGQIESARTLAAACVPGREEWAVTLSNLEAATLYRRFRRATAAAPCELDRSPLDRLYEEVAADL